MEGLLAKISPVVSTLASSASHDIVRVALSFGLIVLVLIWLAAIYRGGAGDEEIEKPVTLMLLSACEENTIHLAPRHLKERSTHDLKAPKVQFFLQVPDRGKYQFKALEAPLRLSIRGRNGVSVHDHEYVSDGNGGQIGINSEVRNKLDDYFKGLYRKEGRRFDPDTARFVIKLKYPASLNLKYLLQEHPDASVRVGAWIFVLTSIFSILQEIIFR